MATPTDSVWFITGCSTGLGAALARCVLAHGWRAVVTARDRSRVAELVRGCEPRALALDLESPTWRSLPERSLLPTRASAASTCLSTMRATATRRRSKRVKKRKSGWSPMVMSPLPGRTSATNRVTRPCAWMPRSSCAASCCMSCRQVSSASATMGCWPTASARSSSSAVANLAAPTPLIELTEEPLDYRDRYERLTGV